MSDIPEEATTPQLIASVRACAESVPVLHARVLLEVAKRLEQTEVDYGRCVREIDRVDRLQIHDMTHEDAWALVYIVHDTMPTARGRPGDVYAYLKTVRADRPDGDPQLDTTGGIDAEGD